MKSLLTNLDGNIIGRHPSETRPEDYAAENIPLLKSAAAIRAKCLDCCAHSTKEVRLCPAKRCPLWAHRLGPLPRHLKATLRRQSTAKGADDAEPYASQ